MRVLLLPPLLALLACAPKGVLMPTGDATRRVVVLVSAEAEWRPVKASLRPVEVEATPVGEAFRASLAPGGPEVTLLHGGYGKLAAAASTQWAIDHWGPALLVNLGTCGGFEGRSQVGDVLLARDTVVYDVVERMGDSTEAIADFSTVLPVLWPARLQARVRMGRLLSGDRDLDPKEVTSLLRRFGGLGGDWESGGIAFVARRNGVPLLVLRQVSDVVSADAGSPTDGNLEGWQAVAAREMAELLGLLGEALPEVLAGPLPPPRAMTPGEVQRREDPGR